MKFEFGDLYKFVVSLGVVLISLSVLGFFLFLKEPFDLFKTEAELKAVTVVARAAILSRQELIAFILKFIPWISAAVGVIGITLICYGLNKWRANQLLLDEQTKLEVEIKRQSLRDATKDEIEAVEAKDFETVVAKGIAPEHYQFSSFQANNRQLEGLVAKRLRDVYDSNYNVEMNKMVGGVEIDILLRGKTMLAKDWIIEVKSIRKGYNYGWLREVFLKNIYAKNIYSQITNRSPNTLLLIVTDFQGETPDKYESLLTRIASEEYGRKGKDLVVMLTKEELQSLPIDAMKDKLGIFS